jgi:hypothetical protein
MAAAGPPCPTCGTPLSWFAERNAWGCGYCPAVPADVPPSPYAPNSAPVAKYSPFRAGPPPAQQAAMLQAAHAPAGPSKRVWLAVGGGITLLVIVAIAFAAAGGSGGGAGSREELVKRTLHAIANRDVDALVALADPVGLMARVVECDDKPRKGDEDRDPDTALRKSREKFEKLTRDLPDELAIELVDLREDREDAKPLIDKGDKMMKGCVAKTAIYLREANAVVKISRAGKPGREQKIEIAIIEVDGRFYLSDPPKLDIAGADDAFEKLVEFKDKMCACRDKECGDRVNDQFTTWGTQMAKKSGSAKPDVDDAKRLADVASAYAECYAKLMRLTIDPPLLPDAGSAGDIPEALSDMSRECIEYRSLVVKYARCDGYPQSARDSVKKTWEGMVQMWPLATGATRASMTDSCRDGSRILRQGLDTLCP